MSPQGEVEEGGAPGLPPVVARLWQRLARIVPSRISLMQDVYSGWVGPGIHRHRTPSLVVAIAGPVRIELGFRRQLDLATGEAAVVGPWVWHAHPPPRAGAVAIIGLRHHELDVVLQWNGGEWIGLLPRRTGDLVSVCVATGAQPQQLHRLLRWLGSASPVSYSLSEPLRLMSDFLWRHRTSPVSAASVLASSGLGYSAAHRLFRDYFGATPKQYLLQCRIELAERLLRDGQSPGEVWAACGFTSRADLSRRFRLARGCPPRQIQRPRA